MMKKIKYLSLSILIVASILLFSNFKPGDKLFEISKNIEIFCALFREVNANYVDEIDPNKAMKTGIEAMLADLDPYTNYYSEDLIEDARFMQTGKYGGIGAVIKKEENKEEIIVVQPYENSPAEKAGLVAGDVILKINGKAVGNRSIADITTILKGEPSTEIILNVRKLINDAVTDVKIIREDIKINAVPFHGMVSQNTGYIKLTSFTQGCSQEVKNALTDLKKNPEFNTLIFDLRSNGGGLLHEAVDIVNIFESKGVEVVYTKGRSEDITSFKTQNNITDGKIPVIVLINSMSASASEIVSGCVQDLDRGIVLGQRSYGKGLVQNTKPLPYNTQVKITTSKYYIPSGRCIQAKDYSNRNADGSVGTVPDSLKKAFKTKNGRVVYDGGGIEPDIKLKPLEAIPIITSLLGNDILFKYANIYYKNNIDKNVDAKTFELNNTEFEAFVVYANKLDFKYKTETEKLIDELEKVAKEEHYHETLSNDIQQLKSKLHGDKKIDLIKNKKIINKLISSEIVLRFLGEKGQIQNSFLFDEEVKKAVNILSNAILYQEILSGKYKEK